MTELDQTTSRLRDFLEEASRIREASGHGNLSVHRHVLHHGRLFSSQALTPQEQQYIDVCDWRAHPRKQCYHNAQLTALTMPPQEGMELRYAEGYVSLGWEYGVDHAWMSLNGKVVDTTLRVEHEDERVMGLIPDGWEYWGVELDPRECLHSLEHGRAGPLLDDWKCHWRLITAG